jgi:hypothetical protein
VRLAAGLAHGAQDDSTLLEQPAVMEHLGLMARHGLVATIEATSDQLGVVTRLTRELSDEGHGGAVVRDPFMIGSPSSQCSARTRAQASAGALTRLAVAS